MHRFLAFASFVLLLAPSAHAQEAAADKPPAPPPPAGAAEEPRVNIPVQEGDEVEEIREGGRVVALRVKPKNGPVYYLIDTSGTGNWMRRESLDSGLRVPMWPIKTWD